VKFRRTYNKRESACSQNDKKKKRERSRKINVAQLSLKVVFFGLTRLAQTMKMEVEAKSFAPSSHKESINHNLITL
jgi:hypothetical protein